MRSLLLVLLLVLPLISFSAQINCYSNGKSIYSGYGKKPEYMDGIFSFEEYKTNKIVFISADCIVKI